MIINHNINALTAYRGMMWHSAMAGRAMERLSTGKRINRAADDAAGLAISEKMRGQIRGLNMSCRNIQDGISLVQTADGTLNEVHSILQRQRELCIEAANGTTTESDKKRIQEEINQLNDEIRRISGDTQFNTKNLFGEEHSKKEDTVYIQAGANQGNVIGIKLFSISLSDLGIYEVDVTKDAEGAIAKFDNAINKVSGIRGYYGAMQNRFEHALSVNQNTAENLQAAESRIRDADMAKEMMNFAKHSILQQVAQAMLAQANRQPNSIIELLKSL